MGSFQTKPSRIECIQRGLLHVNVDIRRVAMRWAHQHVESLKPFLLDQITTKQDSYAGQALSEIIPRGDKYVVDKLLQIVDYDKPVVVNCLGHLANIGDQRVIDELVRIC